MHDSPQATAPQKRPMKLSTSITLMLFSVVGSVLLVVWILWSLQINQATRDGLRDTALAVARTLADDPEVKRSLTDPAERAFIQPLASIIRKRNDLLFVVVTDMQGVRLSHPDADRIGKRFIGEDIEPALKGEENFSINHGVLGQALRVFTPVYDDQHQQIGVVVVGISLSKVDAQIDHIRWNLLWTLLFSALVGSLGIWALVRVLKRRLLGLEPYQISTLFQQRQAMLQSLKEGVMAIDNQGRVTLVNHAARHTLISSGPQTESNRSPLMAELHNVMQTGIPTQDRELSCNGRLLLCNTVPLRRQGIITGAICTFRDKTEVSQLMQRLDGMVNYVDALRTHSHEFMNKLHVILGLLNLKRYDKLEEYVLQTAHNYQTDIGAIQHRIKSPVVAGFLLGKMAHAAQLGVTLTLADDSRVPDNPNEQQVTALVTTLGNLIENALDALSGQVEGEIDMLLHDQNGWLVAEVSDNGPGILPQHIHTLFDKGFSTKGEHRGVGLFLASQQLEALGGSLSVESEPGVFTQFFVHLPWESERKKA